MASAEIISALVCFNPLYLSINRGEIKIMDMYDLVNHLRDLCEAWAFERTNLGTGLYEIETEMRKIMLELLERIPGEE